KGLAERHHAEVVDLPSLLEGVDAVYVCTPTAGHAEIVEAAADAGVAIYCEKPLAKDLAGAERVAGALDRVPHQVGLVLRTAPVFAAMEHRMRSDAYGRTMTVVLRD